MRLTATVLSPAEQRLQGEVRAFLDERLPPGSHPLGLGMAGAVDPEFSRDLGTRGWLGMSLPVEYGGGGRSAVERLIVVEALLARGAPVGHHRIADRQSGPNIAMNGSSELKRELPAGDRLRRVLLRDRDERAGLRLRPRVVAHARRARRRRVAGQRDEGVDLRRVHRHSRPRVLADQRVVTVAQMATMSALVVDRAALAAMDRAASFEITATKLVVSENASTAARAAHQAHGAIGMTREYRLQQLTRRLMAWRSADGAERHLALALGAAVAAAPSLPELISDSRPDLEVRP